MLFSDFFGRTHKEEEDTENKLSSQQIKQIKDNIKLGIELLKKMLLQDGVSDDEKEQIKLAIRRLNNKMNRKQIIDLGLTVELYLINKKFKHPERTRLNPFFVTGKFSEEIDDFVKLHENDSEEAVAQFIVERGHSNMVELSVCQESKHAVIIDSTTYLYYYYSLLETLKERGFKVSLIKPQYSIQDDPISCKYFAAFAANVAGKGSNMFKGLTPQTLSERDPAKLFAQAIYDPDPYNYLLRLFGEDFPQLLSSDIFKKSFHFNYLYDNFPFFTGPDDKHTQYSRDLYFKIDLQDKEMNFAWKYECENLIKKVLEKLKSCPDEFLNNYSPFLEGLISETLNGDLVFKDSVLVSKLGSSKKVTPVHFKDVFKTRIQPALEDICKQIKQYYAFAKSLDSLNVYSYYPAKLIKYSQRHSPIQSILQNRGLEDSYIHEVLRPYYKEEFRNLLAIFTDLSNQNQKEGISKNTPNSNEEVDLEQKVLYEKLKYWLGHDFDKNKPFKPELFTASVVKEYRLQSSDLTAKDKRKLWDEVRMKPYTHTSNSRLNELTRSYNRKKLTLVLPQTWAFLELSNRLQRKFVKLLQSSETVPSHSMIKPR